MLVTEKGESFGKEKGLRLGGNIRVQDTLYVATGCLSLETWPGWAEVHVCLMESESGSFSTDMDSVCIY